MREEVVYPMELQVAVLSLSGVPVGVNIDGAAAETAGVFDEEWTRLPLLATAIESARSHGLSVDIDLQYGQWRFALPATYFLGYERELERIKVQGRPLKVSDTHLASESTGA